MIKIWLDDMRPAPDGWVHCKTIEPVKAYLEQGIVETMSLDHDLGICEKCCEGLTTDEWLIKHQFKSMPHCSHFGTGYDLVCWMEENNMWPVHKPHVHSANPVGAAKMRIAIDKQYE